MAANHTIVVTVRTIVPDLMTFESNEHIVRS
jgi:hypothetical protein